MIELVPQFVYSTRNGSMLFVIERLPKDETCPEDLVGCVLKNDKGEYLGRPWQRKTGRYFNDKEEHPFDAIQMIGRWRQSGTQSR